MRLEEFLDRVYRPLRLRQRSANTTRLHRAAIKSLAKHLGRQPELADLDDLTLADFLDNRAQTKSPWTVERERCSLLALARLAFERRMLEVIPACPPAPLPRAVPRAWTVKELERLIAAASATRGQIADVEAGVFWRALLAVAWETGERVTAIMSTPRANLRGQMLVVDAASRKGKSAARVYSLSPATLALLEAARSAESDRLFHWPYCGATLWNRFRVLLKRAGLEGKRLGFHQIRRSAASHYVAAGGDAAEFLGHAPGSGSKVATAWYVDPTLVEKRPAWELLPKVGGSPAPEGSVPPAPAAAS